MRSRNVTATQHRNRTSRETCRFCRDCCFLAISATVGADCTADRPAPTALAELLVTSRLPAHCQQEMTCTQTDQTAFGLRPGGMTDSSITSSRLKMSESADRPSSASLKGDNAQTLMATPMPSDHRMEAPAHTPSGTSKKPPCGT